MGTQMKPNERSAKRGLADPSGASDAKPKSVGDLAYGSGAGGVLQLEEPAVEAGRFSGVIKTTPLKSLYRFNLALAGRLSRVSSRSAALHAAPLLADSIGDWRLGSA